MPYAARRHGKKVQKLRRGGCIDYKDKNNKLLPIGHSNAESMTFFPNFYLDEQSQILYIDIAGLNDSNGPKVEIIN